MNSHDPQHFSPRPETRSSFEPARIVTSKSLFLDDRVIGIEHEGELYLLKITRQKKLILNK
ncbi:MAG: hemin uptake protein HemP [Mesorhizobium sp.]